MVKNNTLPEINNKDDKSKEDPTLEMQESFEEQESDVQVTVDASLEKAIEVFRKIREQGDPLSDKELADLEKECDTIRNREIIITDIEHEIQELEETGKILMGTPTLTRFEKARIM